MAVTFKVINPILANLGQEIGFPLAISFKGPVLSQLITLVRFRRLQQSLINKILKSRCEILKQVSLLAEYLALKVI